MVPSSRTQFQMVVAVAVLAWLPLVPRTSEAQRRGGGGGRSVGGGAGSVGRTGARTSSGGGNRLSGGNGGAARTSVNRDFGNTSVDRANVNRNVNSANVNNVNVNRNWDMDVDVDNGWNGRPVARGAAFAAGAALTSAAIGSVVYSLPASCSVVAVNGISYQHCGSAWYEPQFAGTSVNYVVVEAPQ
ncbi:MAG TPA: hypothetical protein VGH98_25120 [Gemmatimonadaceae bacterium]|jgi:hypothetical protein